MDIGKYNRKDNKTHSLLHLDRTFPNHKMFVTGSANQLVLFRILAAYYLYNTTIGYCQGKDMIPFSGCTYLNTFHRNGIYCSTITDEFTR